MYKAKFYIGILFLTLSIILVNCEKKPIEKLEKAKSLISQMKIQEAPKYAPEKYEMAINYFEKAQNYIRKNEYNKATLQLNNCISTANSALITAENEKEILAAAEETVADSTVIYTDTTQTETQQEIEQADKTAPPAQEKQQVRYHTVISGECLTELAQKYYGSTKYWKKIYNANDAILPNPHIIRAGQELRIPTMESEKGQMQKRETMAITEGQYSVKKGETLWEIAAKLYPNKKINYWNLIYQVNKDKIINPNLIYAGTELEIPNLADYEFSPGDSVYIVQKGDNLWSISNRLSQLDPANNYDFQEIYMLNVDVLYDTNTIYPGQLLKLRK